jgi:hypothetical protein
MVAPEKGTKDPPEAVFHGPSGVPVQGHSADVPRDIPFMSEIHATRET